MPKEYKIHEYANIFPEMSSTEFNNLKDDIEAVGLQQPIWLYEGKILDGRNRYKACCELDIDIEKNIKEYEGDNPLAFAISSNLNRRELSTSQRAVIALNSLDKIGEDVQTKRIQHIKDTLQAKNTKGKSALEKDFEKEETRAKAIVAHMFGTNRKYVDWAEAINKKDPKLLESIMSGKSSLNKIYRENCEKQKTDKTPLGNYKTFLKKLHNAKLSRILNSEKELKVMYDDFEAKVKEKIAQLKKDKKAKKVDSGKLSQISK